MIKTKRIALCGLTEDGRQDLQEYEWVDGELVLVKDKQPKKTEVITTAQEPLACM